jgi:acyl carrier protein
LDIQRQVLQILDEVLALNGRPAAFTRDTLLHGSLIELDSMAVVTLTAVLEERFGFIIEDSEIDASVFASVGSLVDFVASRLHASTVQRSSAMDSEYR